METETANRHSADEPDAADSCIAVFDIGKTNVKLSLVDPAARIAFERRIPNKVVDAAPYPHVDADAIWQFLIASLAEARRHAPIAALVTVAHGATAALIDEQGALALPILDYEHRGPEEVSGAYEAIRPAFCETQSPALPCGLNLGRQLLWQKTMFPTQFISARRLLLYPQYWTHRLTGRAVAEMTALGCHTDLWCPATRDYSRLVDLMSLRELLPPLSPAACQAGVIREDLAGRIGIPSGTPVLTGIHDSAASFFKHRAGRDTPFVVLSSGTWLIAMAGHAGPIALDHARDCLSNVEIGGAPVPTARFMAGREYETVAGRQSHPLPTRDDLLRALARIMADGMFVTPNHGGEGGPFPGRLGRFIGRAPTDPVERQALASLYVTLMADECVALIGGEGEIIIEGPLGRNGLFASALQGLRPHQEVLLSEDATGAAVGAARLARPGMPCPSLPRSHPLDEETTRKLFRYRETWRSLV